MMFAGAEDLICNYKGIERMLGHMSWGGEVGMGVSRATIGRGKRGTRRRPQDGLRLALI
jgi:hypothetical protein